MSLLRTVYRAGVMMAAGVIAVKGWQLYGPTNEQVKTIGQRAVDMAQVAWNNMQPSAPQSVTPDPRLATPAPVPPAVATTTPPGVIEPAPLFDAPPVSPAEQTAATLTPAPFGESAAVSAAASNSADVDSTTPSATDPLPPLYSKLESLGATNPQLMSWGISEKMYRFWCRAALPGAPAMSQQFEAVATEPVAAVEQVVAKVEAWRASQAAAGRLH